VPVKSGLQFKITVFNALHKKVNISQYSNSVQHFIIYPGTTTVNIALQSQEKKTPL